LFAAALFEPILLGWASGAGVWRNAVSRILPMQRRPEVDLPEPLIYVDTSTIRDGMLSELEAALDDLVAFIDATKPVCSGAAW
jgi:hypothetical protein